MDWLERINAALNFIEDNITCDIDYKQVAQIACCPNYHFQRMFSFITDIPLSEYIRRRRLTLAAFELQQSSMSVIEIAQKYGYESHSAFTRAFNELHGIAPIIARKSGAKLKVYPRISFHISIMGGTEMNYHIERIGAFSAVGVKHRINTDKAHSIKNGYIKKIEFVYFGPYKIIGKEIRTKHEAFNPIYQSKYQTIPSLWQQCFSDGAFDTLLNMREYCPPETPDAYEGYMRDFCNEDGTFTYLAGFFMKADTPVPDGFALYDVAECTIARAWIEGEEFDIYPNAHKLTVEAIQQSGYAVDWENYFSCEVYTDQRFGEPKKNSQKELILDFYIPCNKICK